MKKKKTVIVAHAGDIQILTLLNKQKNVFFLILSIK